jgi:acetylornithine deacetylase/succinyl-diaminopimelate desuccinylase-like protein
MVPAAGDEGGSLARVAAYRDAHAHRILETFVALLGLPNVASDAEGIRRNADFIRDELARRGVTAEVAAIPGAPPAVFGRLDVAGARRTLGLYAHFDGQPVGTAAWSTPGPWKPTLYTARIDRGGRPRPLPGAGEAIDPEWRIYARSAADDKAPLAALFAVLDGVGQGGVPLTANLRILFEGEEEAGSTHLARYLDRYRVPLGEVDGWLILDGPVHPSGRPQLIFGVRGYLGLDLTVYGPNRPLHSGHYGNWAPNPAHKLARLLASMKDDDGRVVIDGFYRSTRELDAAARAALAALPSADDRLREELGLAETEADGAPLAERVLWPSLNVRGLESGEVGEFAADAIPSLARASLDLRLAEGNGVDETAALVVAHLVGRGYRVLDREPSAEERLLHANLVRVDRRPSYPATRTPVDAPFARWVATAAAAAVREAPILVPVLGGSLPLHVFVEVSRKPLVVVPMANPDNNQHAADENLRVGNLWYGIDVLASLLTAE